MAWAEARAEAVVPGKSSQKFSAYVQRLIEQDQRSAARTVRGFPQRIVVEIVDDVIGGGDFVLSREGSAPAGKPAAAATERPGSLLETIRIMEETFDDAVEDARPPSHGGGLINIEKPAPAVAPSRKEVAIIGTELMKIRRRYKAGGAGKDFKFKCPGCFQPLKFSVRALGTKIPCPDCQVMIKLPSLSDLGIHV